MTPLRGYDLISHMLMPLQAPEIWDKINNQLTEIFNYPKENAIRTYPNLYCAVDEVTTQLASFLSHKKSFTWIKGLSPMFEGSLASFLRDGFQVQSVDWKVHQQFGQEPVAWVEALPKDTLFVLGFEEHAVTGQKVNLNLFEEALNNKKIFFIRVSHFQLPDSSQLMPFTVWIGPSGFGSLATVVCGSRFRAPEKVMPYHPWKAPSFQNRKQLIENQTAIQNFEKNFSEWAYFQNVSARRWDRSVLVFPDLSADAIRTRLIAKNVPEDQVVTPNTCFTESYKIMKTWWTPQPTPETLRGMLVIDAAAIIKPDFLTTFQSVIKSLQFDSQWPQN